MKALEYGKDDLTAVINRQGLDYSEILDYVKDIVDSIRNGGDRALVEHTLKFDKTELKSIRVPHEELKKACGRLSPKVLKALKAAHRNITRLHKRQYALIRMEWKCKVSDGVFVGERMTPIESVGCYVPGGRAAYPSTVLMTCVPAKIAGIKRIAVISPPPIPDAVLAACKVAGVDEIYSVGGAQAIAALAYGTESIKPVAKIVGPGNKYVTAAKMLVFGTVDIDMPAGPSEVLIIADDSANPKFIASDILAQAEHDPNAHCVLVTNSEKLVKDVQKAVYEGALSSEKKDILTQSLANFTAVKTKTISESIAFANQYAPEHLEIHTRQAEKDSKKIRNAGAVFIGPYSPVAAGDYASGGNHVLPTGGAARFSSQLSVRDFMKSTSVQNITKAGLKKLAPTIMTIAQAEGLSEHKKSIEKRLNLG